MCGDTSLQDAEMIRPCHGSDFEAILEIVNDGASAYRGTIPDDCWKEPYMPAGELRHEIASGVDFFGVESAGSLVGVMGVQPVQDVVLIRHAYVRTGRQRSGVGSVLLGHIVERAPRPVLLGTWKAARWALRFYEKHGFGVVEGPEQDRLLKAYWDIPARQVEASAVLADPRALREIVPRQAPRRDREDGDQIDIFR
ncbi:MAG: GNAT family N-acetyltransferase, partial [Rhodospirillaceae bacterium]